jgi:hypothetical protein
MDRRTLLKFGSAGLAATVAQVPAHGASVLLSNAGQLARAVFDARFAEARAFGDAFDARGIATSAIQDDVAVLWYGDLKGRLLEQRRPVVGLTTRTALFCLEELARDVGMKVQGRIDHSFEGGRLAHRATGPDAWLGAGTRLGATPGYGRVMAALLADPVLHGGSFAAQKLSGPFEAVEKQQLVSWWIA